MINALALRVFMVLTHTWLDNFCGGILVSSHGLGVLWEILMLCSSRMTAKGGWLLIRFLVMKSLTGLILIIFLVCILLDLAIFWCNGKRGLHRIHRRLDRALCNEVCLNERDYCTY